MTNQERISSNNALVRQAITKANALPDAGSGGASVETCMLTINGNGTGIATAAATVYENGCFDVVYITSAEQISEKAINNVVCGSFVICSFTGSGGFNLSGAQFLMGSTYKVTATDGETATITFVPF